MYDYEDTFLKNMRSKTGLNDISCADIAAHISKNGEISKLLPAECHQHQLQPIKQSLNENCESTIKKHKIIRRSDLHYCRNL